MKQRLVTKRGGIVISRWASNDLLLQQIQEKQKKIDPDAIFGFIDPRQSHNVNLSEMFNVNNTSRLDKRGSSAKNWRDDSEFTTPLLLQKAEQQNYKIGHHAPISTFNPYEVPEG